MEVKVRSSSKTPFFFFSSKKRESLTEGGRGFSLRMDGAVEGRVAVVDFRVDAGERRVLRRRLQGHLLDEAARTHGAGPLHKLPTEERHSTLRSLPGTRSKTAPEDHLFLSHTWSFHKRDTQNTLRVLFPNAALRQKPREGRFRVSTIDTCILFVGRD